MFFFSENFKSYLRPVKKEISKLKCWPHDRYVQVQHSIFTQDLVKTPFIGITTIILCDMEAIHFYLC